jgi:hypothetical protein
MKKEKNYLLLKIGEKKLISEWINIFAICRVVHNRYYEGTYTLSFFPPAMSEF